MTLNKKLSISLAVMALGMIAPFVFDWWFSLHHEWYGHRDGLDVAVFWSNYFVQRREHGH